MNYKVQGVMRRYKTKIILVLIIWLLLTVVFALPLSCAITEIQLEGLDFITAIGKNIGTPLGCLGKVFGENYIGNFLIFDIYFDTLE